MGCVPISVQPLRPRRALRNSRRVLRVTIAAKTREGKAPQALAEFLAESGVCERFAVQINCHFERAWCLLTTMRMIGLLPTIE